MKFFLDQYGCAKNQVDGELLIGILYAQGWEKCDEPEQADLIIINSCGFIESAKKESLEAVITAHEAYPNAKVLLAGCLAERYAPDLLNSLHEADGFFGNGELERLPEVLNQLFPKSLSSANVAQKGLDSGQELLQDSSTKPMLVPSQVGVCSGDRPMLLSFPRSAYVKITEGCDNWCSFCAIPIIRGALRNRSIASIVNEIKELVARNVFEINLIGQDLGAYNEGDLASLLRAIATIEGKFRVRLLYIHPDHFPRDILPIMKEDPRFYPYFDIPFQSGSDSIIHAMNRKGSAQTYLDLVQDIRAAFDYPVAIRTTFLVGFPGETEASFKQTQEFLTALKPTWSGAFVYSKEEGTTAFSMKGQISTKTAEKRALVLQDIQTEITTKILGGFVGETLEVLVEELIPEPTIDSKLALGRAWFQAPEVDGAVVFSFEQDDCDIDGNKICPGSVVLARVVAVNGVDLSAVCVQS